MRGKSWIRWRVAAAALGAAGTLAGAAINGSDAPAVPVAGDCPQIVCGFGVSSAVVVVALEGGDPTCPEWGCGTNHNEVLL